MSEHIYGQRAHGELDDASSLLTTFTDILCQVVRMSREYIGVANKTQYLQRSWALPNDSKHAEASFSAIFTDALHLRVAQMSRSPDLGIFVLTTDDRQTDDRRQTKPITLPLAHARGVIIQAHYRHSTLSSDLYVDIVNESSISCP